MDRYRYFIFNQKNMVVLGLFQVAFSTVCVGSGFIDGLFRTESHLSKTRAPIWAGMVKSHYIFYAFFRVFCFPTLPASGQHGGGRKDNTSCQLFPGFLECR